MSNDLVTKIAEVKRNLDLQLEDIIFGKTGVKVELYYDTADVIDAVLGSRVFYPPFEESFNEEKFNSSRTLVQSLLASGWFGKIRMLPPHQAEFLTRLRFYFGVDIATDPKGEAQHFLHDVGLNDVSKFIDLPPGELNKEKLIDFIKKQAGVTEKLYKAIQCMVPWHRRLARWEAHGILDIETQRPRYDEIIQGEEFNALKKEFDRRRKNSPVNNFADAMAIAVIIQRLADIKYKKIIPRFYASSDLFEDVIDRMGITQHLLYESPLGGQSSIFCGANYYIYKAAFVPKARKDSDLQASVSAENYLRDLSGKVASALELQEKLTPDELTRIKDLTGKPLSAIMDELQEFSFLENVWLKFEAPQDMDQALREVVEASRGMARSDAYRQGVAQAIRATEDKFTQKVEEFKWISSIWDRVDKAAANLRARIRGGSSSSEEFFRDLGLFRYAFPESTHEKIRNVLQEIVAGEEAEKSARISVIAAAYRGRKNPTRELDRLIIAAAIMLATKMYSEINSLLTGINPLPHKSLKIVFGEVLFRLKRRVDRCIELISELEEEYRKTEGQLERADLAVGIAYLFFRLWRNFGGGAKWRTNIQASELSSSKNLEHYIETSIEYAKRAYELYDEEHSMKKTYALNIYLYYMVEAGNPVQAELMEDLAIRLSDYVTEPELWQYRFDDTLSRFLHYKALRAENIEERNRLLGEAERLSNKALNEAPDDEDVQQHVTQLVVTRSRRFRG